MKAMKVKTISSPLKRTSTKVSFISKESSQTVILPTPKDFDSFIPWVCLQFQIPRVVTVQRLNQEEYRPRGRRHSATRSKLKTDHKKKSESVESLKKKESSSSSSFLSTASSDVNNTIPIKTYYNHKGHLVEVAFVNCPCNIHRKVIRAINLSLPFHPLFYRLTIRGGGLVPTVLYEISKLLPYSNLTDICLDDNYVAEGNYYVILDKESRLQNLSLRRCEINDDISIVLASKLNYGSPGSKSLLTLDLSSNRITDLGAKAFANMLRKNRKLLHLSLADNGISDKGAFYIFDHLVSFPLTDSEVYELKKRYLEYCFKKVKTYKECEIELINRLKEEDEKENRMLMKRLTTTKHDDKERKQNVKRITELSKQEEKYIPAQTKRLTEISKTMAKDPMSTRRLSDISKHRRSSRKFKKHDASFIFKEPNIIAQIEKLTKDIVGDFEDIFDDNNIRCKRTQMYSVGNLRLCSLNIAYNDLSFLSLNKICNILKYQKDLKKPDKCKGLIRIKLDGNNFPKNCPELEIIETFLDMAITENISLSDFSRSASTIKSFKKLPRK